MKKTQSLLSPFNSQPAVFARVCLPAPKTGSEAALRRRHHGKSIGADLNLHPLPILSLTKHHTLRCCAALQSP